MIKEKQLSVKENRRIIFENPKFGLFQGKLKKEYDKLRTKFQEGTKHGIAIDDLIDEITEIKEFIETNLKDKYTNIFIHPQRDDLDYDICNYHFNVEIGRYENDVEYHERINKERKRKEEEESKKLKREAEQYLKLKNKFKE